MAPMGQRYRQKKRWIKTDPTKITRISAPPIENIGFTPGQCPMELYCPNTCHGPAMFHFIIPLHTKTAQNRSTPYLIPVSYTHLDVYKRQQIHRPSPADPQGLSTSWMPISDFFSYFSTPMKPLLCSMALYDFSSVPVRPSAFRTGNSA